MQLANLEREFVRKGNSTRRVRKGNPGLFEDEDLELQLARLEGETVRKSEEFDRRNIRRVFVEEAPAVEELAEAAAVRKAEEDWSK